MTPIFYINLDARTDRRKHIEGELKRLGLTGERIAAVHVSDVPQDLIDAVKRPGHFHEVNLGDLACGLSHQKVWRLMKERQLPAALILEDDAVLTPAVLPFLDDGLLETLEAGLVRLETRRGRVAMGKISARVGEMELRELASSHFGTAAYMISRAAAEASLVAADVNHMTVDRFLTGRYGPHLWRTNILQSVPAPVVQLDRLDVPGVEKGVAMDSAGASEIDKFKAAGPRRKKRWLAQIRQDYICLVPRLMQILRDPLTLAPRRRVPFAGDAPNPSLRSIH